MLLFAVLQFLATLSMLSAIGNLGSMAPLIIDIITIVSPAISLLMNIVSALKWISRMLSVIYALIKNWGARFCKWTQLVVIYLSTLTPARRSMGIKSGDLLFEDNTLPTTLEILSHCGGYAGEGHSCGSHPALPVPQPTNAFDTLASSSLPTSIASGDDLRNLPMMSASSLLDGRRQPFYPFYTGQVFPFPPCSWWTNIIRGVELLWALVVALCLDIGINKPQSSWANPPTSPPSHFMIDHNKLHTAQLRTPQSQSGLFLEKHDLQTVVADTTPMKTDGEANVNQANVGQAKAFAQVLILLAMIMVPIENEIVDTLVPNIIVAPETEEILEQTIAVEPDSLNRNDSISFESAYLSSMITSAKGVSHEEEDSEQTFGSFEENTRSLSQMFNALTQESEDTQVSDHPASNNHEIPSKPNLIVTNEQGKISVSDTDEILGEFSLKTKVSSDGSAETADSNLGKGSPSSDLLNSSSHLEKCLPLHQDDGNEQTFAFCPTLNSEQWPDSPQGVVSDLVLPDTQNCDIAVIDEFNELLRQFPSSVDIVADVCDADPALNNENITQRPLPTSLEQVPDFGQIAAPVAEHEQLEDVLDFASWFESAENQKLMDDLVVDFPFPLDGPDPNLEAALAALDAGRASCVSSDDDQLQQWLDSLPEPAAGLEGITSPPVHNNNWSPDVPAPTTAQPELSATPPSNVVGQSQPYFADYDHFTTDHLFAPESDVIIVSLPRSAALANARVNLDEGHSISTIQVDTSFADSDVSSSSTLVELGEETNVEATKTVSGDCASGTNISFGSCAPAPVTNLHDKGVVPSSETREKLIDISPPPSVHVPTSASNTVPIVDVSAVLEREQTCHYVIAGVETYDEVKAKFDLYDLFTAVVTRNREVQGVSASMHAVKGSVSEDVGPVDAAPITVTGERNDHISSDVVRTPMQRERPIPAVRQNKAEPVRFPSALANTLSLASVAPAAPLKERKDGSIYKSMWASCSTDSITPQTQHPRRTHTDSPKVFKAPRIEGPGWPDDKSSNASIWADRPTKRKALGPTTPKHADIVLCDVSKSTQDRSINSSVYADCPEPQKPVPPKPKSSFGFSSTRVDDHRGKDATSGWTREDFEGAQILLGFSAKR